MLSLSLISRGIRRQPLFGHRHSPIWKNNQLRRNTTATTATIAESITKPVSEAPESIQEETIKGTPFHF
jgi:hypothetical protein